MQVNRSREIVQNVIERQRRNLYGEFLKLQQKNPPSLQISQLSSPKASINTTNFSSKK